MNESNLRGSDPPEPGGGGAVLSSDDASGTLPALIYPPGLLGLSPSTLQRLSPAALAYIGDAVFELYIRLTCLMPPKRLADYHSQVVSHVRAEQQSVYLRSLEPYLTDKELDIVKRGRNAASKGHRRANPDLYQQASGLEALIGYLYLTDPHRLTALFAQLEPDLKGTDSVRQS